MNAALRAVRSLFKASRQQPRPRIFNVVRWACCFAALLLLAAGVYALWENL